MPPNAAVNADSRRRGFARAVVAAGRDDIALYTGNDDTIVTDLLTPFTFTHQGQPVTRRIVGGLLGTAALLVAWLVAGPRPAVAPFAAGCFITPMAAVAACSSATVEPSCGYSVL